MLRDLATLIAMPSAGDLVIYGTGAPEGNVSYIPEVGAHAGPSPDELHTFIVAPSRVAVPADHPPARSSTTCSSPTRSRDPDHGREL